MTTVPPNWNLVVVVGHQRKRLLFNSSALEKISLPLRSLIQTTVNQNIQPPTLHLPHDDSAAFGQIHDILHNRPLPPSTNLLDAILQAREYEFAGELVVAVRRWLDWIPPTPSALDCWSRSTAACLMDLDRPFRLWTGMLIDCHHRSFFLLLGDTRDKGLGAKLSSK